MGPLLKLLALLVVPVAELVVNAIEDAKDRRFERRRKQRMDEALVVERNRQLEDERHRHQEAEARKRIRQTRGPGSTPVPGPGDRETPEPPETRAGHPWDDD